jgi:hypothetical protein
MSVVFDHFGPAFQPWFTPTKTFPDTTQPYGPLPNETISNPETVKKIIDDFAKAREAAKIVDELTKKTDCVDPEKAKLLEKVERLEKIIDALLAAKKDKP